MYDSKLNLLLLMMSS